MAKVSLRLDTRRKLQTGDYPLKIAVARKGRTIYIPTGRTLKDSEWDKTLMKVVPLKTNSVLNLRLSKMLSSVEEKLLELQNNGLLKGMSDKQLLAYLSTDTEQAEQNDSFFSYQANNFLLTKTNKRTIEIYQATITHIKRFCDYDCLQCEDITVSWLKNFEAYLCNFSPSANARAIHLRNIRAIINYAIDNEVLDSYAFRRFKIKTEETEKRSLTLEQLQTLLHAEVKKSQKKYIDCFFLIFYLIGINMIDLSRLREIRGGRIVYKRAKTGRLYNIKVEPEAEEIISRYKGKVFLLRFFDTNKDYRNFEKKLNDAVTQVAKDNGIDERITTYWARHSWATIAASIDITRDIISESLGHKYGSSVTAVYVNFDRKKIDEANRKVIDLLHNLDKD